MIKQCRRCGCNYNNETAKVCPLCNIDKFDKRDKKNKKKKKKNRDGKFGGIGSFIFQDMIDKRRTASGYRHRVKTGGSSLN